MADLRLAKSITTLRGSVKKLSRNGQVFWQKGDDYTFLEYVACDQTAEQVGHVDTGIDTSDTIGVEIKFKATNTASDLILFGSGYVWGERQFEISKDGRTGSTQLRLIYGATTTIKTATWKDGTIYTCVHFKSERIVNGTSYSRSVGTLEPGYRIYIFASNRTKNYDGQNHPVKVNAKEYIYYLKMYTTTNGKRSGATLVRDFRPCRRNRDGKVGFYDNVSGQFFGNTLNDNNFEAGPEVSV